MFVQLGLLRKLAHRSINTLLYILYPASCIACKRLVEYRAVLCPYCWEQIKPVVSVYLPVSGTVALPVFAATAYQDPIKKLVTAKFYYHYVASKQLADVMVALLPRHLLEVDYLVPIPLHWSRYMHRGYNQSLVIAQQISKKTGIPVLKALRRSRMTKYQWQCSKEERSCNVRHAFTATRQARLVQGKRVLFVDDLCTTGATLQNAARVLVAAQPLSMQAAVGCRAV